MIQVLLPLKILEFDYCECVFEKKDQLDDHIRDMHGVQFTGERKLVCCIWSDNKRFKTEHCHHECFYCECAFQKKYLLKNHICTVHQRPKCHQILLTEEIRAQHQIKHDEEQRKKLEAEKLQTGNYDNLVVNYLLTNKLDEYRTDTDFKPELLYILR